MMTWRVKWWATWWRWWWTIRSTTCPSTTCCMSRRWLIRKTARRSIFRKSSQRKEGRNGTDLIRLVWPLLLIQLLFTVSPPLNASDSITTNLAWAWVGGIILHHNLNQLPRFELAHQLFDLWFIPIVLWCLRNTLRVHTTFKTTHIYLSWYWKLFVFLQTQHRGRCTCWMYTNFADRGTHILLIKKREQLEHWDSHSFQAKSFSKPRFRKWTSVRVVTAGLC